MAKPTVLIIAPDDLSRRVTADCLEVYDHSVLVADDADQGAAVLKTAGRIGAVIVDADQAGDEYDGLTVAQLAIELDPRVLVVYTSRRPQRLPERLLIRGAPTVRIPFGPQQIASLLGELRDTRGDARCAPNRPRGIRRSISLAGSQVAHAF